MIHPSQNLQPSLFEDETPRAVLAGAQTVGLAALVEALLREIATALVARLGLRPFGLSL